MMKKFGHWYVYEFFTELAFTVAFSTRVGQLTIGQEISESNFLVLISSKNQRNIFLISTLASKMGVIKRLYIALIRGHLIL